MIISLSPDVRTRLDAHLDAVERALITAGGGGSSREHRRGVVDDLEAQILDMLAGKSDSPTLADLDAVLATLDPPAAYGDPAAPRPVLPAPVAKPPAFSGRPRVSRTAICGLICILISFLPAPVIAALIYFFAANTTPAPRVQVLIPPVQSIGPEQAVQPLTTVPAQVEHTSAHFGNFFGIDACLLLPLLALALAGTLLGWIAFIQIRTSRGTLRGTALALFDGLFYPAVFFALLAAILVAKFTHW